MNQCKIPNKIMHLPLITISLSEIGIQVIISNKIYHTLINKINETIKDNMSHNIILHNKIMGLLNNHKI